jgi:acid phosphatase type 7
MTSRRLRFVGIVAVLMLAIVGLLRLSVRVSDAQTVSEIVLHTASAKVVGGWQIVADTSAASGRAAVFPDAGRPRVSTPVAAPADYFELTFNAVANTPYRLWVRGRADGNLTGNDSAHVQFSDSVNSSGAAAWRIGSTSAATIILESCTGCGVSGWGWEDNGWGTPTTLGPEIRFASTGAKTLRVQTREDGFFIDQIVLSPSRYRTTAPGSNRNDSTRLVPTTPPPPLTPMVTMVRFPYLQQVTDRSAIIVWSTRESGTATARVNSRTFTASSTRFSAARTGFAYDYFQHEATVTGLNPGTSYGYELYVGSARAASGSSFRTAPTSGSTTFIAFGDSGIGSTAQKALAARMSADAWSFAVHVGDIVYGSTNTSGDATYKTYQWWFFDTYRDWLKQRGFFPSMGNHDSRSTNNNGQAYLDLFVLPDEAGASAYPDHAERYYSFDYGSIHFVALDTERAFQDPARRQVQLQWLRNDLSTTSKPWKITFWHRAPYAAAGEHGSDLVVRQAFGPLMEEFGVQLALTGHEHMYERTVPWRESTNTARQAVTYIVTGGGGARLYSAGIASWTAFSKSDYQYLRVNVNGCVLTTTSIDRSGGVMDSFTLDRCKQALDAAKPTVRVTAPATGARVSGVVTITATAADDVRVEKVDFWIDGVLRRIDRTASYSYAWDSRTVPAGTHTIQARAYDIDGNRVSSATVTVTTTGT